MILVTDGEQRSALAVVRSLGRAGYTVAVCSAQTRPLAAASRHCRAVYSVPDPAIDSDAFTKAVERIVDLEGADLVIPMTDASAPLLLELHERRPDVAIPFPDLRTYEGISNKSLLMQVATELGVPVPRQVVLTDPSEASGRTLTDVAQGQLAWPLILKPARSAVLTRGVIQRFGVRTVLGRDSLSVEIAGYPPEAYPILMQERIVGPGLAAFMLGDSEGRTLASFAHKRLREKPPPGGVSVYRESVRMRDDVREYAERIMARYRWSGAVMLEFEEDASTGTPYLMEANGRFWGSLQLAIDAGVDFPRLLVECALGAENEPVNTYRTGVRSRWLWGDFDHLLWILRAPATDRSFHPSLPGRLGAIGRFLLPWRPGDRYEVLRWDDSRPFLRESVQWIRSLRG